MAYPQLQYGLNNSYQAYQPRYDLLQQPQLQPSISLKGRPVASIDEVRASMIDFDGSVFYFPNIAQKCIYTKQMNLDGTSSLQIYQLIENSNVENNNQKIDVGDFVSRETFERVVSELSAEIENLKSQKNIPIVKEEIKNDKPTEFNF